MNITEKQEMIEEALQKLSGVACTLDMLRNDFQTRGLMEHTEILYKLVRRVDSARVKFAKVKP